MSRLNQNPFSRVMHPADASTLLRNIQQVVEIISRAWCGVSLTERGSVTVFDTFWQRSTMTHSHRSALPVKHISRISQCLFFPLTLTPSALNLFPSIPRIKMRGGHQP